jgi:hypothetical protein
MIHSVNWYLLLLSILYFSQVSEEVIIPRTQTVILVPRFSVRVAFPAHLSVVSVSSSSLSLFSDFQFFPSDRGIVQDPQSTFVWYERFTSPRDCHFGFRQCSRLHWYCIIVLLTTPPLSSSLWPCSFFFSHFSQKTNRNLFPLTARP